MWLRDHTTRDYGPEPLPRLSAPGESHRRWSSFNSAVPLDPKIAIVANSSVVLGEKDAFRSPAPDPASEPDQNASPPKPMLSQLRPLSFSM